MKWQCVLGNVFIINKTLCVEYHLHMHSGAVDANTEHYDDELADYYTALLLLITRMQTEDIKSLYSVVELQHNLRGGRKIWRAIVSLEKIF